MTGCSADLEGQGESPDATDCEANMLQRHADDLLAVMDRLACRGGHPCEHPPLPNALQAPTERASQGAATSLATLAEAWPL